MVNQIKKQTEALAGQAGLEVRFTGIAADEDPSLGYDHLQKTGPYDEINIGGYYFNLGHMAFVWHDDFAGPGSVPQLLVKRSTFEIEPAGMGIGNVIRDEKLLERYTGSDGIEELLQLLSENELEEVVEYWDL